MITFNRDLSERDFAQLFQGHIVECQERFGSLGAAVASELASREAYGYTNFCEWGEDGYPLVRDGRIVRTPDYEEFWQKVSAG